MARVRSLVVNLNLKHPRTGVTQRDVYDFLDQPAPLLEGFELVASDSDSILHSYPLHSELFHGHAPQLVRFSTRDAFEVPWTSPLFTNLAHLTVEYNIKSVTWRYRRHPTLSTILALLHRARHMTTLTLVGCLPTRVREGEAWSKRVDLPELTYIRLGGVSVGV
ncbi:hypothetical protein OF83DRAFT_1172226, partial [Amylostereum chailletii]